MKLETRYYVANRTEDGLINITREETGPYYDVSVLITSDGYDTRQQAVEAVARYVNLYKAKYGWDPRYAFMILEEYTFVEDDE